MYDWKNWNSLNDQYKDMEVLYVYMIEICVTIKIMWQNYL